MPVDILGFDEDYNMIILLTDYGVVFMVHLDLLQFEKHSETMSYCLCYPFTGFYTAGKIAHLHIAATENK
uniref:Uncharacterized protein n=1 Tax=Arundo donax TaxID=35708 RepID=A0A0A9BR55_ARUDO